MSISKNALAAVAALSLLFATTATPNMAIAAKDGMQAYAASDGNKSSKKKASKKSSKKSDAKKSSTSKKSAKKSSKSNKSAKKSSKKSTKVTVKTHTRDRVVVRSTAVTVPLVVIGSPVVYRAYGPGWCRALHRGHHWAPGIGWHSGKHVGRVKC